MIIIPNRQKTVLDGVVDHAGNDHGDDLRIGWGAPGYSGAHHAGDDREDDPSSWTELVGDHHRDFCQTCWEQSPLR